MSLRQAIDGYARFLMRNMDITSQTVLASFLVQVFGLAMPVFYIVIFDRVFGRNNLATLDVIAIGILLVLFFDACVKFLRSFLLTHHINRLNQRSILAFIGLIFSSESNLSQESKSTLSADDTAHVTSLHQQFCQRVWPGTLDFIFCGVVFVILLLLNPIMALVSMTPLIPISLYSIWHTPGAQARSKAVNLDQKEFRTRLAESIGNNEALTMMNVTEKQKELLVSHYMTSEDKAQGHRRDMTSQGNAHGIFTNIGSMLTLYVGAHLVLNGTITFGVYIAINMMSRSVMGAIQKFFTAMLEFQLQLQQTMVSPELLFPSYTPERRNPATRKMVFSKLPIGNIVLDGLTCRYFSNDATERPALNSVSCMIPAKENWIVTGYGGAGKTTLCKSLVGLLPAVHGSISLDGYMYQDISPVDLRCHVVLIPQKPAMFSGTLYRNIAMANPEATHQDVLDAVKFALLEDTIHSFNDGLDHTVAPLGMNLSSDVIRKVAIARAYLTTPAVLVVDDILTGLPSEEKVTLINRILNHFNNSTIIMVTNFLPLHTKANGIILLKDGELREQGTFQELIKKEGEYFAMFSPPQASGAAGAPSPEPETDSDALPDSTTARPKTSVMNINKSL